MASVSTATVSRCLNTPERVAEPTRKRILKAVKSLGYSPNFGAQALAARRTHTFGAIIPTMTNAIFARGLQAFQDELVSRGATLLVASSSYDPDIEENQIRSMIARGADGLLLIGTRRSASLYRFLRQRQVPVVITWTYGKKNGFSFVGFDNIAATRSLTERAITLGHTRFAMLSANLSNNDRASDRVEGVRQALEAGQLNSATLPIIESPYSIEAAGQAFRQIMTSTPRPSIVMCGNDVQAVGAVKMAHHMGLRIPRDISITGFDDIELASVIEPGLTTVRVPHQDMGRQAAITLFAQVYAAADPQRIKLPTTLIERDTLGPPAS